MDDKLKFLEIKGIYCTVTGSKLECDDAVEEAQQLANKYVTDVTFLFDGIPFLIQPGSKTAREEARRKAGTSSITGYKGE